MHHRDHHHHHHPLKGRRWRQHDGCHAGETVRVVAPAPHFSGYWLVEADCGKRWAMRERIVHSRVAEHAR